MPTTPFLVCSDSEATLLRITGADALEWLQGQTSQDLRDFAVGDARGTCLCRATGQIESVATLYRVAPEEVLVVTDSTSIAVWEDRLDRMVILEEIAGEVIPAPAWWVQGVDWRGEGAAQARTEGGWRLRFDRTGRPGFLVIVRESEMPIEAKGAKLINEADLRWQGLRNGIPRAGWDYDERTLPPELGPRFESAHVSYTKGCYLGQEVLQRIHSRGHVNRQWVALEGSQELPKGVALHLPGSERAAGTVRYSLLAPEGWTGEPWLTSAYLPRDAAHPETVLRVGGADGPESVRVVSRG